MKRPVILFCQLLFAVMATAQNYPEPEFSNEVYFLKKDSVYTVMRLEKNSANMETKTKLGGLGGQESGYTFDGSRSPVRLSGKNNYYFVFSTAAVDRSSATKNDTMMKANGIDPSIMQGMMGGMNDPQIL